MGLLDIFGMGADSRPTVSDLAIAEAGRAVQASATGQTYQADTLTDLVRMALSGAGGGSFRGPFSYRQAVERVLDCDPLDTAVRLRARAASQVPIRLSRIKGTSKRDRARTRMSVVRALAAGGDTTRGSALRLPHDAEAPEAVDLPTRNAFGRRDPHGALTGAVVMHQMEEAGDMEAVTEHPVLDLIAHPNRLTTTTWPQLLDAVVLQRLAWGEIFARPALRAMRLGLGAAPELFLVEDPSSVTVVLNERKNRLLGYDLADHGGARRERTLDGETPDVGPDDLVHIKDVDPLCFLRGRTHLRSLWVWSEIYLQAARWNGGLIANGAKPSGVLSRRDGRAVGGQQRQRVAEKAQRDLSGPENAGKPMTDGELAWTQISFSPRDMDWGSVVPLSFRRLATGVGVDPLLLGVGEHSTFNNLGTASGRLYTEAALPDLAWFLAGLNEGVVPLLSGDEDLVLWADPTDIPALRGDALELSKALKNSTWLTDAEKRTASGYPAEGGPGADQTSGTSASGNGAGE